jgi:uncharacterized cupin superfamily protein
MPIVTELLDAFPIDETICQLQRDEELLLTKPDAKAMPGGVKMWRDHDLLYAYTFPTKYVPSKFALPRGVFESEHVHIEWQKMNFRQPFYHRNVDVDEIGYHISGERTLITEKGSVDLQVGDFARIPVGVAHDNRGVEDVHLIFYIPAPVNECITPSRKAEFKMPPFPGWEGKAVVEMMTDCLGSAHCDVSVSLADERKLLEAAISDPEPLTVLRASNSAETEWIYKSPFVWLGSTTLSKTNGRVYKRHRRADEMQYQVKGQRTLVTQRGTLELEAGDFVNIPLGCAFTDIVHGDSTHLSVLSRWPAPPKQDGSKVAVETTIELVAKLRKEIHEG